MALIIEREVVARIEVPRTVTVKAEAGQGPSGAIALQSHLDASDPHPQYVTEAELNEALTDSLSDYASQSAVAAVQSLIEAEATVRQAADTALDARLDAVEGDLPTRALASALVAEADARQAADTALGARLDAVEGDLLTRALASALVAEADARQAADSDLQTAIAGKQNVLGFTPLNPTNNLSEVSNPATAKANLGLNLVPNFDPTAGVVWISPTNIQWSASSKPTVRPISVNDSNALVAGDKWLKTTNNTWHDWNGTYWLKKVPPAMARASGFDINSMFYTLSIFPPLSSDGYPKFFLRQIRAYITFGLVTWDSDNKVDLQLRMASRDASIGSPIVLPDTVESLAGIYNKRIVATKVYNQFVSFPDDFTGTGALEIRTVNRVGDPNPSEGSTLYEIEMFPVEL